MINYSKICPYCKYPSCVYKNNGKIVHSVCVYQGIINDELRVNKIRNCQLKRKINEADKNLEEKVALS